MVQEYDLRVEYDSRAREALSVDPEISTAFVYFGGISNCTLDYNSVTLFLPRTAGLAGLKGSAKGESPTAPLVMEMARVVIGQKGDDTSIITPNLDSVSVRPSVIS